MGSGIAGRLRRAGHEVVGYDTDPAITGIGSLEALVAALQPPRAVWVMVPAGAPTQTTLHVLAQLLDAGDIVIEGGNSNYHDSSRRAEELATSGIMMLDCGTSGGVWGLERGFCLMTGGPREAFERVEPLLAALAPPDGYAHLGPSGAGHFAKMVHNGIEYGLLQAYAEGFQLLQASRFEYDLGRVASLWNHGSVIESWLLALAGRAFKKDAGLDDLHGYVNDSGEGRWTVEEAVSHAVPMPAISAALFARFASREEDSFAMRFIAALRNEFGGHAVREREP